jgi:hydrogenase maturation protease
MNGKKKILLLGYGNPSRSDDALGIAFAESIQAWVERECIRNIDIGTNYQLNIEDAATMADKDVVIFVDATYEKINGFKFEEIKPSHLAEFSMHSVSPEYLLSLCEQVFERYPKAYVLRIRGYEWDLGEEISVGAERNLGLAMDYLKEQLQNSLMLIQHFDIICNPN